MQSVTVTKFISLTNVFAMLIIQVIIGIKNET